MINYFTFQDYLKFTILMGADANPSLTHTHTTQQQLVVVQAKSWM